MEGCVFENNNFLFGVIYLDSSQGVLNTSEFSENISEEGAGVGVISNSTLNILSILIFLFELL